jgi:hypothetical protein
MQNITLSDNQEVVVTATPEDAEGNASQNFVSCTWVPANPAICSIVNLAGNQLSGTLVAGEPGTTTVLVTGQNAASGGAAYSTSFQVTVLGGPATQFSFSFGTPTTQS